MPYLKSIKASLTKQYLVYWNQTDKYSAIIYAKSEEEAANKYKRHDYSYKEIHVEGAPDPSTVFLEEYAGDDGQINPLIHLLGELQCKTYDDEKLDDIKNQLKFTMSLVKKVGD